MRFATAAFLFVAVAGLLFTLFIVWNYALYEPDSGLFIKLNESAEQNMNAGNFNKFQTSMDHIGTGIGLAGVVSFGLAVICFIADALSRPRYDD